MKISKATIRVIMWLTSIGVLTNAAIACYYANEIRVARAETPLLVAETKKRFGAPLKLTDLSRDRRAILLSIEDPAFDRHHGIDLETPGAGMTTITQGLVKLIYFPNGFKPGVAKVRQALIAQYVFDSLVFKDEQMQLFLNICYLGSKNGQPVHGYAAAAQAYFSKDFAALTDEEFLSLVAMHISPDRMQPGTSENMRRVQRIQAYLSGNYQPASLLDIDYDEKQHGTLAEEALVLFLRLITDAKPPPISRDSN